MYPDPATGWKTIAGYTPLYQPDEIQVTIPAAEQGLAGTYTTYASYNVDGSPYATTLPAVGDLAKETVTWEYDDLGNPRKMSGARMAAARPNTSPRPTTPGTASWRGHSSERPASESGCRTTTRTAPGD